MIKVIIIDDEHMAQESIHILLDKYFEGQFDVVAKASSVLGGIKAINKFNPDLVFLDIQMPEQNGFDLFEAFDKIDFKVIFTTAHEEYARKAIKHQPFDYLLKPIDLQELRETIGRLKSEITTNKDAILDKLDKLESKLNGKRVEIFNTQEGDYVVNFDEIIFCKGEGNYTEIIRTNGGKILVSKNLKKIEEILPADEFIRIHQSTLVNRSQIDRYDKKMLNLYLKNGDELPVSMRKLSNIFNGF